MPRPSVNGDHAEPEKRQVVDHSGSELLPIVGLHDSWRSKHTKLSYQMVSYFCGHLCFHWIQPAKLCEMVSSVKDPLELAVRLTTHVYEIDLQSQKKLQSSCWTAL